eukprot:7398130-Alexandrium_andersonii.AAC.1
MMTEKAFVDWAGAAEGGRKDPLDAAAEWKSMAEGPDVYSNKGKDRKTGRTNLEQMWSTRRSSSPSATSTPSAGPWRSRRRKQWQP